MNIQEYEEKKNVRETDRKRKIQMLNINKYTVCPKKITIGLSASIAFFFHSFFHLLISATFSN